MKQPGEELPQHGLPAGSPVAWTVDDAAKRSWTIYPYSVPEIAVPANDWVHRAVTAFPDQARILILRKGDESILRNVAPDVFDRPMNDSCLGHFLGDPRHHIAVAIQGSMVVGFATAVHYLNPDKPAELWINEVSVASAHRRHGLGRRLIESLLERATSLGCENAWVLTGPDNRAAQRLYAGLPDATHSNAVIYEFKLRGQSKIVP